MNYHEFLSNVQKTSSCWIWKGTRTKTKYGGYYGYASGTTRLAHRLSYELFVGSIPNGLHVCHHCDNGLCVNPRHLFLGTPNDNAKDRNQKNRQARGERMNTHKLTEKQIKDIRRLWKDGTKEVDIARQFNVTQANICYILKRKTWAWLPD